ncbi:MAG: NAD(P)-dependent oxidoreductase [Armatimonadetes bacterium]|nr:NAD(P)-dependent oxidoreductase [Armatimonadota bacterium]
MKILVTGACGRIGSHAVRQLLARGVDVAGIDSHVHPGNLRELTKKIPLVPVDVTDLGGLLRVITTEKIQRIIHLAAAIGDHYDTYPWGSYQVNLGGTLLVLEAARHAGVERVAMASTHNIYPPNYGVYGPPEWRPIAEDHPPDPRRPYAVMKLACEYMGRIYAGRFGVDFAAVRYASYYGAERAIRRGNRPPDLLNRMILDAVEGASTVVPRGGDWVFDPVYIKDCAHGVICAALAEGPRNGGIYNIGGGRAVTLRQAAETVRRALPGARIEVGPGESFSDEGEQYHPPLDITRARREIGYEPQFPLEAGVADCARELRIMLGKGV